MIPYTYWIGLSLEMAHPLPAIYHGEDGSEDFQLVRVDDDEMEVHGWGWLTHDWQLIGTEDGHGEWMASVIPARGEPLWQTWNHRPESIRSPITRRDLYEMDLVPDYTILKRATHDGGTLPRGWVQPD